MRVPLSLTARLGLLFAVLTACLLIVVGVVLGRAAEDHFRELDEHELSGKFSLIAKLLQRVASAAELEALPQALDDAFTGHDSVSLLMRDDEGSVIYALNAAQFAPAQLSGEVLADGGVWRLDGKDFVGREVVLEMPLSSRPVRVLLGLDISHHTRFLDEVRMRMWIGIAVATMVAALLGWMAAHKGLAPLRRVTEVARRQSADRLGERLIEGDAPAEVRELVEALNGMFERLEQSFQRLADFSADIAHELRTPVSNLMTQTAVALSRARSTEEYREVLGSNLEEYERIARMVSDMLFLAQTENGLLPRPAELVSLADEARALAEFYDALAEEQGVRVEVNGEARVSGDRLMLRRAVSNLLSNALRHASRGTKVDIDVSASKGEAVLRVCNAGDSIVPEQLGRIFERFHRAGPERHRHGEGAGLGLAITRSIVEAHGGRVSAVSEAGRTVFEIVLPLAPVP
ncbi:MAG: heavy metal sensor histidine kinase [Azoarcus sp.]|nr:MAG: heavy metal sensor histidine kinase [Azoarcus sp. PHD]